MGRGLWIEASGKASGDRARTRAQAPQVSDSPSTPQRGIPWRHTQGRGQPGSWGDRSSVLAQVGRSSLPSRLMQTSCGLCREVESWTFPGRQGPTRWVCPRAHVTSARKPGSQTSRTNRTGGLIPRMSAEGKLGGCRGGATPPPSPSLPRWRRGQGQNFKQTAAKSKGLPQPRARPRLAQLGQGREAHSRPRRWKGPVTLRQ